MLQNNICKCKRGSTERVTGCIDKINVQNGQVIKSDINPYLFKINYNPDIIDF